LVIEFWKILEIGIKSISDTAELHCIKLYETPRNFVEYYG
jgi:6-pyruvoyltetrahydropterin/6-carboxytetrahydropterin synthase